MTAAHARILIVDDDETVLRTFAKALSLEGYDVRTAASPAVGYGMDIALYCDIRIASDRAKFGWFFVRRAVMGTIGGTYILRQLVGLEEAEQSAPDAILLDLRMPFINGFGFLYRLRALGAHRHTPVAIITGDSCIDDPALNELHDLNAEVLFKPIWLEEVLSVTRSLLAKRKPADPKPS